MSGHHHLRVFTDEDYNIASSIMVYTHHVKILLRFCHVITFLSFSSDLYALSFLLYICTYAGV